MRFMTKTQIALLALASLPFTSLTLSLTACMHDVEEGFDYIEPEDDRSNEAYQGLYDCTERSDNGYRQGSRFAITVVKVDNKPVETNTANAYIAMQNAARNDGVNLRIVSGFRTMAEQQYLYNCYINGNCNNGNLAARPGYSNHQSGHALDLNTSDSGVSSWLNRKGAQFGFNRTVASEPWHWEWWGNDSDYEGPCGDEGGPTQGGGGNADPGAGAPEDCEAVSAEGGLIDDGDACFVPGGPTQYLRAVDGEGHDGDLVWTGTTDNNNAVNFAEWHIRVGAAGRYTVEVYVDADVGTTSRQAAYNVHHDGVLDRVVVSQQSTGWKSLGAFTFAASGNEKIRVGDNTGESGRKLILDAIRLTPQECPRIEVITDGDPLNVRPNPNTDRAAVGTLADGEVVERRATTSSGQAIQGSTTWHQIQKGNLVGWVSGAFTRCAP